MEGRRRGWSGGVRPEKTKPRFLFERSTEEERGFDPQGEDASPAAEGGSPLDAYSAAELARLAVLVALAGCATVWDLRTRRVPDRLTLSAALAGLLIGLAERGLAGAGWSAGGLLLGGAVLAPAVWLGYVGAGDMKLLAAAGALLGPLGAVRALLAGAVLGGLWALLWLAVRRRRTLPYAPPLAAGAVVAFFL